VSFQLRHVSFY